MLSLKRSSYLTKTDFYCDVLKKVYIGSMFSLGTYNNWKLTKNNVSHPFYNSNHKLLFWEKFHVKSTYLMISMCNGLIYAFYPITLWYLFVRLEMYLKNIEINDDNAFYWNEYYEKYKK
jgi:hypothetical protein